MPREGHLDRLAVFREIGAKSSRSSPRPYQGGLFLRERMQVAHQALQALLHHMRVDLRGRDVGVAEQRLDDAQIGAVMQKVAGEGMSQHMRRYQARHEARGRSQFLQVARKMLSRQMAAFTERRKQPFG